MTELSQKILLNAKGHDDINIIYRIFFKNAFYSLESYKEGWTDSKDYCYIENLTDDEGEAESFLKLMVIGRVYPVHIKELAQDYFR